MSIVDLMLLSLLKILSVSSLSASLLFLFGFALRNDADGEFRIEFSILFFFSFGLLLGEFLQQCGLHRASRYRYLHLQTYFSFLWSSSWRICCSSKCIGFSLSLSLSSSLLVEITLTSSNLNLAFALSFDFFDAGFKRAFGSVIVWIWVPRSFEA